MRPSSATALLCAALLSCGAVHVARGMSYGEEFWGNATYYGDSSGGNCVLREPVPPMYAGMTPVAMNAAQYAGSASCGACLRVRGTGEGSGANPVVGEFLAYVADQCPECHHGDIDIAKPGDGRWRVSWKFVPCPAGDGKVAFKFEGSNPYYYKLQPRGTKTPPVRVRVADVDADRSQDNFWIANGSPFPSPVRVQVWCADGSHYDENVSGYSGVVYGGYPVGTGMTSPQNTNSLQAASASPTPAPATQAPTRPATTASSSSSTAATCTADYQRCAGAENRPYHEYHPCCSQDWECVQHPDIVWGKQCRPPSRR